MGSYVYRTTAQKVLCSDGQKANVALFAYKPYRGWGNDGLNTKMHFRTGCTSSDAMADRGNVTGRIVIGHKGDDGRVTFGEAPAVYASSHGSFYDDGLGGSSMPKLDGVTIVR